MSLTIIFIVMLLCVFHCENSFFFSKQSHCISFSLVYCMVMQVIAKLACHASSKQTFFIIQCLLSPDFILWNGIWLSTDTVVLATPFVLCVTFISDFKRRGVFTHVILCPRTPRSCRFFSNLCYFMRRDAPLTTKNSFQECKIISLHESAFKGPKGFQGSANFKVG